MTQDPAGPSGPSDPPPSQGPATPPPAYGGQPPSGQPPQYGPPPQVPPPYRQPYAQQPMRPEEERQWAMFAHLGGLLGVLPSLIIYLVFKDRGPFVRDQAREALNFQITMLIAYIGAVVLRAILSFFWNPPFWLLVWVVSIVFSVIGGMAANRGESYRYPFALRVIT